jgi:RimJ/RimL family protein N-acetyltransferase
MGAMQYGIQRRNVYLVPAEPADLAYVFDAFDDREVWEMYGFEAPSRKHIEEKHREGNLVVGVIRRVADRSRIGFAVVFPPPLFLHQWEYSIVIRDPKDRDAFSAINASDVIAHYIFDHLRIPDGMWRIRADNRPSNAIAKRMGYKPCAVIKVGENRFNFYRIDQQIWGKRRDRIGTDDFLTLTAPPFEPVTSS